MHAHVFVFSPMQSNSVVEVDLMKVFAAFGELGSMVDNISAEDIGKIPGYYKACMCVLQFSETFGDRVFEKLKITKETDQQLFRDLLEVGRVFEKYPEWTKMYVKKKYEWPKWDILCGQPRECIEVVAAVIVDEAEKEK